jgi:PAS domain S-box-containing protein
MKKVLIVDDNADNLYILEVMLKGNGFDVITATNGSEALESAYRTPPDLIISDILMPVMDGFTLCRKWKADERLKHIPFIFYTATYTGAKDEQFALSLGADRFIIKPQEPETLINLLAEFLGEEHTVQPTSIRPLGEEMEFFGQYNEILSGKLEKKMLDLEAANQKLKEEEEALQRDEEFLDSIIENIPDMIFVKEADNLRFVRVNKAAEKLLGLTKQEMIGKNDYDFFSKSQADFFTERDRKVLEKKQLVDIPEEPIQTRQLGERILHTKKVPIIEKGGKAQYLLGISEDITERRRTEQALRDAETRYRLLFEHYADGVVILDPETARFLEFNETAHRQLGYSREEFARLKVSDLVIDKTHEEVMSNIARVMRKGREDFETHQRTKQGESRNIHVTAQVTEILGHPVYHCIWRDITERKRAEERTKHLASFPQLNPSPIIEVDTAGEITFCNPGTHRALEDLAMGGEECEAFLPEDLGDILRNWDKKTESALHREVLLKNRVFAETIHLVPQFNVARVYARDITESKQAEEKLKATTEKLRQLLVGTVRAISLIVETRDPYTAGHQRKVSNLGWVIAQEMALPNDTVENIRMAGIIHDIGKISVPAEILSKPTKLTDIEFSLIKAHPRAGYNILKETGLPYPIAQIVLQHHERLDGSGYPEGLKAGQILLEAQIVSVADVVEATASHRPYRPALGIGVALEEIERNKGILYGEKVVEACLKLFREKGFTFEPG